MPLQLPQPTVSPRGIGTPYQADRAYDASSTVQRGVQGLAQDVSSAGRELGGAVNEYEARQEREKHKADTVRVNNGLTELDKEGTDSLYGTANPTPQQAADAEFDGIDVSRGYLASRGLTAQEISKGTYDRLQKKAKEIGDRMDVDQKAMFDGQAQRMLEGYYARIEAHAAAQRTQAELDSLKAAEAEALRKASLEPANDESARMSIGRIVGAQDQFVTSTEDAFAKAEEVQGKVTAARLDALLAQPGGFTDAERVLRDNKGAIARMGRFDEYSKRVEAAKLGGRAAAVASQLVNALEPTVDELYRFRAPQLTELEAGLAKLAEQDPELAQVAAPIARAQYAHRARAVAQERERFIDDAAAAYNSNHATFFSSESARRLNLVDPDKYRSLWNETHGRARAASGDAAELKAQKLRDDEAMAAYRAYGDLGARSGLTLDTWFAGKGLSDKGKDLIRREQLDDKSKQQKGLEVSEKHFVGEVKRRLAPFAPKPGSKKANAAAKAWWQQVENDAIDAYNGVLNAHPERKPTAEELRKARAAVIAEHPPDPKSSEQLRENVEAIIELGGGGKPARTGRKKVWEGKTYWETTDGGYEVE